MENEKDPIKVCHLTSVHSRADVRVFYKECASLSDAGFEVHLIVADGLGRSRKNQIEIHDVGKPKSRLTRVSKTIWDILQYALALNAEIYHFHDPELIPIGLWLSYRNKKVIYDVHEDLPRQILSKPWIAPSLRKILSISAEVIENFAARHVSSVITATPFILDRYIAIGAKATNVNNYPILKEFSLVAEWKSRKNQICYVGGIAEVRGIFPLVDSLELLETKLYLAGGYSSEELRNSLTKKEGWSHVIEHGYIGREEIQEILSTSKIGMVTLLPIVNYLDSLPIKMFEYMASGIPFVASDFPFWQSIVNEHKCGVCADPTNPKSIAEAVSFLLDNDDLAEEMGRRGRVAVMEYYNWENESKKLIALYQALTIL